MIYTTGFTGEMAEEAAFATWFREWFLNRFPTPARNRAAITNALAQAYGLVIRGEDAFSIDVEMSASQIVDYELSTTNIIAAAERKDATLDQAAAWMRESIMPFFGGSPRRTFRFAGTIWYLEKQAA